MSKVTLKDEAATFEATLLTAIHPTRLVLFAVGSGGNPERHLPLLNSFVDDGCTVIAPHFERLTSPMPSAGDLLLRARRLKAALDSITNTSLVTIGVGHSIGATLLLALAGGQMWMQTEQQLIIPKDERLKKLVLFAPPTGFYQAPNALDAIQIPVQAWAGTSDTITPPAQIEFLKRSLPTEVVIDTHVVEGAGHFSFMNTLPPQMTDPMVDREAFLNRLTGEVCRFVKA